MAFSAAAAAAASATGAHVNHNATTTQVVQLGALGGVMKSGILNFTTLVSMTSNNLYITLPLVFMGSTFGMAVLVTLALSQNVLQRSKQQLSSLDIYASD